MVTDHNLDVVVIYLHSRTEFELREVTLLEVTNILKELSNSTTMGPDELDALTLKLVSKSITKSIHHILNLSILTQTYCNKWKLGKLLPLHKGGDEDKLSSKAYRPISIIPIIKNIMEMTMQQQVLKFMENSGQFNKKNIHAYRSIHSTTTVALQLTDYMI